MISIRRLIRVMCLAGLMILTACLETTTEETDNLEQQSRCAPSSRKIDVLGQGAFSGNFCVLSQGQVKCWGQNEYGQLVTGDTEDYGDGPNEMGKCLPRIPLGTIKAVSLASTNEMNRCALMENGQVLCWGKNSRGTLGAGDIIDRLSGNEWGSGMPYVNFGANRLSTALVAGVSEYCALNTDGKVRCWGARTTYAYHPDNPGFVGDSLADINAVYQPVPFAGVKTAQKLFGGSRAFCALLNDNSVYCWSYDCTPTSLNYAGPVFNCTDLYPNAGLAIGELDFGEPVSQISIGDQYACALLTSGNVRCWGTNNYGILGQGNATHYGRTIATASEIPNIPYVNLGTGRTAKSIHAGAYHACAILDNNDLKCWGNNAYGSLGLGDTNHRGDDAGEMGDNLPAVDLGSGKYAKSVSVAMYATCAILNDDTVKCWGRNTPEGYLGTGDENSVGGFANQMGDFLNAIALW